MQASTSVLQVIMPNSFSNCFGDGWLWLVVCQQQPRLCLKDVGNVRFLEPVTQKQSGGDWYVDYNIYMTILRINNDNKWLVYYSSKDLKIFKFNFWCCCGEWTRTIMLTNDKEGRLRPTTRRERLQKWRWTHF